MSIGTPTVYGDNIQRPSANGELYVPDQLIAGDAKLVTTNVTLKSGQGVVKRGTVLGVVTIGAATSAAKGGGNTGTGTFVLDVTTPVLINAIPGIYTLRNILVAANSGTFRLTDPKGVVLGDYVITGGAGGSVLVNDRIKGVITDGGVDFILGDGFDVTLAAGNGKAIVSVATAVDGTGVPVGILVDDTDTTADAIAGMYQTGEFNGNAITYDASWTLATITAALRIYNIFVKPSLQAINPT